MINVIQVNQDLPKKPRVVAGESFLTSAIRFFGQDLYVPLCVAELPLAITASWLQDNKFTRVQSWSEKYYYCVAD